MVSLLSGVKKGLADFVATLRSKTEQIERLRQQRDNLETKPLPRSDLADLECAKIDKLGDQYIENLSLALNCRRHRPLADYPGVDTIAAHSAGGKIPTVNLAWLFRDVIKERLRDAIMDPRFQWADDGDCGLPQAERKPLIEKLDREIEKLEAEETAMRQEAEQANINIGRVAPKTVKGVKS